MKTGTCRQCGERKPLQRPPFHSQTCAAAWAIHYMNSNVYGRILLTPLSRRPQQAAQRPWWRRALSALGGGRA